MVRSIRSQLPCSNATAYSKIIVLCRRDGCCYTVPCTIIGKEYIRIERQLPLSCLS